MSVVDKLNPTQYLPELGELQQYSVDEQSYLLARKLCDSLFMDAETTGPSPSTLAGAALYISTLASPDSDPLSQAQAAEMTGTTFVSINAHMGIVSQHALNNIDLNPYAVNSEILKRIASGGDARPIAHSQRQVIDK